jgi:transposase-like protein
VLRPRITALFWAKSPTFGSVMADEIQAEPRLPICPKCNESTQVHPIKMGTRFEGVQYWRCEVCGRVWGTFYEKPNNPR